MTEAIFSIALRLWSPSVHGTRKVITGRSCMYDLPVYSSAFFPHARHESCPLRLDSEQCNIDIYGHGSHDWLGCGVWILGSLASADGCESAARQLAFAARCHFSRALRSRDDVRFHSIRTFHAKSEERKRPTDNAFHVTSGRQTRRGLSNTPVAAHSTQYPQEFSFIFRSVWHAGCPFPPWLLYPPPSLPTDPASEDSQTFHEDPKGC
ncbi:hypothetical protein B0J11DRAFT_104841 [Dendryphion nanum]|uniref:Uncharacterized protein n=1 Tax=Dendryphion nanum TaxID=256645 RepID=A0A9P9IDN9_9PLEO|nr:hypothetical protein B0J11DRAFT_104841 [Dendryphion nanum]